MLKLRLKRMGKPHMPLYRIVVTEHTKATAGEYLEKLGNYNPTTKEIVLNKEKIIGWLNNGAIPSNTVAKLLEKNGIKHKLIVIKKFKLRKSKSEVSGSDKPEAETSTNKTADKIEGSVVESNNEVNKIEENNKNQPVVESIEKSNESDNTSTSQKELDK